MVVMGGGEGPQGLIPFGKYRGQPIEVLLADHSYLQWLLAQAWFAQQYAQLHTLVLNRGVVPDETPEHNALQLLFLDEGICRQACRAWHAAYPSKINEWLRAEQFCDIANVMFERDGIDVWIHYTAAAYEKTEYLTARRIERRIEWKWARANRVLSLELKPSLGDDYPAVLRKMLNGSGMMLVYEAWQSQMPVSQVERLFMKSGKLLIGLDTLRTYPAHACPMPTEPPAED